MLIISQKKKISTIHDKLYPVEVQLCMTCSHLFLKHFINQNNYYKKKFTYRTQVTQELKHHFLLEIKKIFKKFKIKKNSLCVDIGSNDGTILSIFKKHKMKFIGIEPSIQISKLANSKGLKTINSFFNESTVKKIIWDVGYPTVISSTYTFANIEDTKKFLKNIKNLLSNEGIFIVETGYHPQQMKNNMFDYFYHEHFSYFSLKSLKKLLNNSGFKILEARITSPKSGSLLVVAKKIKEINKSYELPVASEKKILRQEKKNGVYQKKFYEKFSKKIYVLKKKLHKKLNKIKKNGHPIAGYGASHSSTLLVHQFELSNFLNFLVDDNRNKHFTYSPNFKLPVFPSKKIYKDDVKNILLLAWNKKNLIVNNHKEFIDSKGKFILPF